MDHMTASSPRAEVPVPDNPVLSGATTATAQQLLAHSVFPPVGRTRPASFGARVTDRIDGDGLWALIGFIVGIVMWGYGPTWFAILCTAAVGGHVGYRWIQRFGPGE